MKHYFCAFNDRAVTLLSHPGVVAVWWAASAGSVGWTIVQPSMISMTLGLSILALAYASAISERQLRTEGVTFERDRILHAKIDDLIDVIPEAHNELIGSEPDPVDKTRP